MGEEAYNAMMREKKQVYRARIKPKAEEIEKEVVETKKEPTRMEVVMNNLDALDALKNTFTNLKTKGEKELRPTTIDNYVQKINRLAVLMTGKGYSGDNSFLLNPEKLADALDKADLKSKKDYITPVVRLLRHIGVSADNVEMYQKRMKSFKESEYSLRKENKASKSDLQNAIPLPEIKQMIKDYKPKTNTQLLYKAIVSMYFMGDKDSLVPRNNLPDFKLVSSTKKVKDMNPEFNYFVMKDGTPIGVLMNRYKSQTTYGRQKFSLSGFQQEVLRNYLHQFGKKAGDFAFSQEQNEPFSNEQFSEILKKATFDILGKPMNVNLIRKIIATDYWKDGLHSIADDERQARRFLHSVAQNREYVKPEFVDREED
jgi:hypothetical protein